MPRTFEELLAAAQSDIPEQSALDKQMGLSGQVSDISEGRPRSFEELQASALEGTATSLRGPEPSYGEVLGAIPTVSGQLLKQSAGGALQMHLPDVEMFQEAIRFGEEMSAQARKRIAEVTPRNMSFWQQAVFSAGTSLAHSGAMIVPAMLLKNPWLMVAGFGELEATRSYDENIAAGLPPDEALRSAMIKGYIFEALTELLPAKALLADTNLFNKFVNFMKTELPGENIAEVGQLFTDYVYGLEDDVTLQDVVETIQLTSAATLLGGGAQVGLARGAQKLLGAEKFDKVKVEPEPEDRITKEEAAEEEVFTELEAEVGREDATLPVPEVGEATPEEFTQAQRQQDSLASEISETDVLVGPRPSMQESDSAEFARQHMERGLRIDQELAVRGAVDEPVGPATGLELARNKELSELRITQPAITTGPGGLGDIFAADLLITQTGRQGQMLQKVADARLQPGQVVESWEGGRDKEAQAAGRAAVNTLSRWVKSYMPDARVVVVSPESWERLSFKPFNAKGKATFGSDGTLYVSYNLNKISSEATSPTAARRSLFINLGHEFGHQLINHSFIDQPTNVRNALLNAHKQYVERAMTQPASVWAREFMSPAMLANWTAHIPDIDSITAIELMDRLNAEGHRPGGKHPANYYFNFDEFMAQSFARYTISREAPFVEVEGFWKKVEATLRRFFKEHLGKFMPNTTAELWFEQLATQAYMDSIPRSVSQKSLSEIVAEANPINLDAPLDAPPGSPPIVAAERTEKAAKGLGLDIPADHSPAKMNVFIKNMFNLVQVARENAHVPGVTDYTEGVRSWWADKSSWTQLANTRLGEWELGKTDTIKFNKVIFDITLESDRMGKKLKPERKAEIFAEHELDQEVAGALLEKMQGDFELAIKGDPAQGITGLFDVLRADAARRLSENQTALDETLARYDKEQTQLLNRDYFPLTRFGKYFTRVRAAFPVKIRGVRFAADETISYEMYETRGEMDKRKAQLHKQFPKHLVGDGKISDISRPFMGMPRQLIENFIGRLDIVGDLTSKQQDDIKAELNMIAHEMAPSQSYKKHLLHRKGIAGFSYDAKRVYANYFMHFANHIARAKYAYSLSQARGRVEDHAKRMEQASIVGRSSVPERLLSDFVEEHYDYSMNPGNELANLRSAGFLWYLGFLPKSAFINLTQIPMVALPYLSSQYGDVKTIGALTRAGKDIRKLFRSSNEKDSGLAKWEDELIGLGVKAGFLDESLATDLAAVAEGSNLVKAAPGTLLRSERAAAATRQMASWGAFLFQKAEKLNRLQTFMATTRLEMQKQIGNKNFDSLPRVEQLTALKSSFVAGRDAIEQTMFEYARWNRPKFMRGKKSIIFLFQNFVQNMSYFAARGPARMRFAMGMLLLAGIQGLPGAEDLLDALDWGGTWMKQMLGMKNPKVDLRLWMRDLLDPLGDPDYFMHGLSQDSFGMPAVLDIMGIPFPSFDLGGSMSLGRIVPGVEPILSLTSPEGEFKQAFPDMVTDVGGAFISIPMAMMQAIADDNPNTFKRFERALPSAIRSLTKAYGYATEGALRRDRSQLSMFDLSDPMHVAEIVGQGLGFQPSRLSKKKSLEWAKSEHARYYEARRRFVMAQFDEAIRLRDREQIAEMRLAVRAYNEQAPRGLGISSKDLRQSLKSRARNRALRERGLPLSRRNIRLYRGIEEEFTNAEE